MDKSKLSERDICTKLIAPAIEKAGWNQRQISEEVSLTDGRVMVRGQLAARISNPEIKGGPKRADYGRGWSERNLAYMIRFAEVFPDFSFCRRCVQN